MYVCGQLNNEPAEIHIKVASFSGQNESEGEHSLFFKRPRTLKDQTFPKSCGEDGKKISSFEGLFHGNFLFCSQLETKS